MIDNIFKLRFVEEVAKIANPKDKETKMRLRLFALLSFILAFGSTFAIVELILKAFRTPKPFSLVDFFVIVILFGFAATFLLTLLIFLIAYSRNAMILRCLPGLDFGINNNKFAPGDDIEVVLKFGLIKRELKEVRLNFFCEKETRRTVLDVASVILEKPLSQDIVIGEALVPNGDVYDHKLKLSIPADALKTQPKLSKDKERVTWGIRVYFDFKDWYTYEMDISFVVD